MNKNTIFLLGGIAILYFISQKAPAATIPTGPGRTDPIPQIPGEIAPGKPAEVSGMTKFRTRNAWTA